MRVERSVCRVTSYPKQDPLRKANLRTPRPEVASNLLQYMGLSKESKAEQRGLKTPCVPYQSEDE